MKALRFSRMLRFIWDVSLGKIFWVLFAPKEILDESSSGDLETKFSKIDEHKYKIVKAQNCTIFTNRIDNITFSVHKKLIPAVSWQFDNGKTLGDSENKLLTGEIRPTSPPKKINESVVCLLTGGGGNYNYFHWLYDCLPRLKLCEPFFNEKSLPKFLVPENSLPFQKKTLEYLDIAESQQISSRDVHHITCNFVIASSHPNPDFNHVPKWIVSFLREKFLHFAKSIQQPQRIYISRKDYTNKRVLKNEEELINLLEPFGFKSFRLSDLQFEEQVSLFNRAEIIVGLHGAGLANLTFCNANATVIELFSNEEQPKMYESISKSLNLTYKSFNCLEKNEDESDPKESTIVLSDKHLSNIAAILKQLT